MKATTPMWTIEDRGFDSPCWIWRSTSANGYGVMRYANGKQTTAHRWSHEQHIGPIPEGLVVDHLCSQRACVNPDHLEAVTQRENVMRGSGLAAANARKTECPQGHAYDEENTYIKPDGKRVCRTCKLEQQRMRRAA